MAADACMVLEEPIAWFIKKNATIWDYVGGRGEEVRRRLGGEGKGRGKERRGSGGGSGKGIQEEEEKEEDKLV